MRVKWRVSDGYVGKERPHYTDVPDEEIREFMTKDAKLALIADYIREDFEERITWAFDCDIDSMIEEVSQ